MKVTLHQKQVMADRVDRIRHELETKKKALQKIKDKQEQLKIEIEYLEFEYQQFSGFVGQYEVG